MFSQKECSARKKNWGLSDDASGIMFLDPDLPLGASSGKGSPFGGLGLRCEHHSESFGLPLHDRVSPEKWLP